MILWYGYTVWRGVPNAKTVPIPVGTHELITAGIPVPVPNPNQNSITPKVHRNQLILTEKPKAIHWEPMQKNEMQTTELKDAMLDFLGQMGQCDHDYLQKLDLVGGDGLTYEKLVQLQQYLQFHDDTFQSLELLVPVLEL